MVKQGKAEETGSRAARDADKASSKKWVRGIQEDERSWPTHHLHNPSALLPFSNRTLRRSYPWPPPHLPLVASAPGEPHLAFCRCCQHA